MTAAALATTILTQYTGISTIIVDLPDVIAGTREHIEDAGLSDRCECIAGDFFESIPAGGEANLMASVIHDWDDDRTITILRNCQRAMSRSARLLLIEMGIPPGDTPFFGKLLDLMILVNLDGSERTEAEYRSLLSAAGLRLARTIPTEVPSCIIEAPFE